MKKMHTKDAKIEDAYKYYGDLNPVMKEMPPVQSPSSNTTGNTGANSRQSPSGIIVDEHFGGGPRTNESSSGTSVEDQHRQLVESYNNETDPQRKQEIRKQIDEFERKH